MREENQFTQVDPFDELDSSSDESSDFDSPERPRQTLISKFMCSKTNEVNITEEIITLLCFFCWHFFIDYILCFVFLIGRIIRRDYP